LRYLPAGHCFLSFRPVSFLGRNTAALPPPRYRFTPTVSAGSPRGGQPEGMGFLSRFPLSGSPVDFSRVLLLSMLLLVRNYLAHASPFRFSYFSARLRLFRPFLLFWPEPEWKGAIHFFNAWPRPFHFLPGFSGRGSLKDPPVFLFLRFYFFFFFP